MENLIQRIRLAMSAGADLEQIHNAYIKAGVHEYDFFLAYKAAELLNQAEQEDEIRMKRRAPPFGRKP